PAGGSRASARMDATMPASALPAGLPTLPRRRALRILTAGLSGGLVSVAAGCRRGGTGAGARPATPPSTAPPGPDPLRADLADTRRLLDGYDKTVRAPPARAAGLRPLRANPAAHVAALQQAIGAAPAASTTATPTGTTAAGTAAASTTATSNLPPGTTPTETGPTGGARTTGPPGTPARLPRDPAPALAALRSLEHAAVSARSAAAVRASGGRAALLASIAACSASHEVMLA